MHQHHHHVLHGLDKRAPAPVLTTYNGVVMSVVYVTAQPTFTGVIGGYSTATEDVQTSTLQLTRATASASTSAAPSTVSASDAASSESIINFATLLSSSSTVSSSKATALVSSIAVASTTFSTSASRQVLSSQTSSAVAGAATTSAAVSSSSDSSSDGMSAGAKAGLAAGIILALGLVAVLCLFLLAKKRRQREQQTRLDDEKDEARARATIAPIMTSSPSAPRLSLRPVSRLVPDLMGGARSKGRLSQGNMLTTFSESTNTSGHGSSSFGSGAVATTHHAVTRPTNTQENPFQDPTNPFADPEKAADSNNTATAPRLAAGTVVADSTPPFGEPRAELAAAPLAMPVAASLRSVQAPAQVGATALPSSLSQSASPAPKQAPVSSSVDTAPAPVVAQGPGPDLPQGNVYRILMDFNPTMEDELGLKAGQHVRVLHEYDDGWALCIRLDRSKQGVVPRTCLAAKPSKPRPNPGPRGPMPSSPQSFRSAPPPSGRGSPATPRPMTPNGAAKTVSAAPSSSPTSAPTQSTPPQQQSPPRATSPGGFNQAPRPLSPGPRPQKRSMSPGPYGAGGPKPMAEGSQRRRSNSASAMNVRERRNSPPGPSKLGPGSPPTRSESPGIAM